MWLYGGLFLSALSSATLLPGSSEVLLTGLSIAHPTTLVWLWLVATVGNVLGSCINYWLGMHMTRYQDAAWFPVSKQRLHKATEHFNRYGVVSLLFAWVPIIGDPLTLFAGVMAVKKRLFILLVTISKGMRYALIIMMATGVEQVVN